MTRHRRGSVLYIVRQPTSGLVKVGISDDLPRRLAEIQAHCGQLLEVLGTYDLGDIETHCHQIGAEHCTLGEWFKPEVLDVLAAWLPRRPGKPFLSRCAVCQRWFRVKGGKGMICGSDLCRKTQVREVGRMAAADPYRPTKALTTTIKVSACAVCRARLERRGRGKARVLCGSAECRREYSIRLAGPTNKKCDVSDCHRRALTRGWCSTHYARWRAHGDPTVALPRGGAVPKERVV